MFPPVQIKRPEKNDLKLHLFWNKDSLPVEIHAISGGVELNCGS